jgi:hypothetical protein
MQTRPIAQQPSLLDRAQTSRLLARSSAIVLVSLGWFAARLGAGTSLALARTETFTLLAVCEWFNVLNCRSQHALRAAPGLAAQPLVARGTRAQQRPPRAGDLLAAARRGLPHGSDRPGAGARDRVAREPGAVVGRAAQMARSPQRRHHSCRHAQRTCLGFGSGQERTMNPQATIAAVGRPDHRSSRGWNTSRGSVAERVVRNAPCSVFVVR